MPTRTGAQYIADLKAHPRELWVQGERVADVTFHPVFAPMISEIAALYDLQHADETRDLTTYIEPETGERAGLAFMPARSIDDLRRRRNAFRIYAEQSFGLMGRSPDFLNTTILAFFEAQDVFAQGGEQYGRNIADYYRYVRDNDLFLGHALNTPQNDRSRSSREQVDTAMHLRVVEEREDGIVVNGARMFATLGAIADEMLIFNLPNLKPGEEDYALAFATPVDAKGIRQISREPYARGDKASFDHPLSSRFEENDTFLIFDHVFVPWNRVFCYRDVTLANGLSVHSAMRNHTAHQTNVRVLVKMQFATGVAMAVARAIKADQFLHVQQMLGECRGYVELIKSSILRAEEEYEPTLIGTLRCAMDPMQAIRLVLPTMYPRVVEVIQLIAAGGLMNMPSGADLTVPELADDIDKYFKGAEGMPSLDRIRLFKLAWDLTGEAAGARAVQYERYYAGDPVRLKAAFYLGCKDATMSELVDRALALSGDPQPLRFETARPATAPRLQAVGHQAI